VNRHHLFEFNELRGCPDVLRRLVTGCLEATAALFRPFSRERELDMVVRAMRSTGGTRFVDLCSGNGGPWFQLIEQVRQRAGEPVSVTLTDRFPSAEAARRAQAAGGVSCFMEPVDARRVPEHLRGVRTLFNGLHHLRPDDARAVFQDAVAHGQPVAVFEMLERNWLAVVRGGLLAASVPLLTLFVRPLTWQRIVLTYLIPVAPLLLLWDSVVSVLRCYRPDELRAMVDGLNGPRYTWEIGKYWHHTAAVTYAVGYPDDALAEEK